MSLDKSVSEKSAKSLEIRKELTRVILLQDWASEVVEEHVCSEGSLDLVSVGILDGFLLFLLLGLLTLLALVLRLAGVVLARLAFGLRRLLLRSLGLVLGAFFLTMVFTYKRIKIGIRSLWMG